MTPRGTAGAIFRLGLAALALTACNATSTSPEPASPVATEETASKRASGGPAPAARSGELGQEDLPPPSALGKRWAYRIDPGDAEEGYRGSGEPAIARKPSSVLEALTPFGCRPRPLPTPTHALEVTYRRGAMPGVGLVLQFASAPAAERFFAVHGDVLGECDQARRIDLDVLYRTANMLMSTRIEELGTTPTWVEGVRLSGDQITLIAVADSSPNGIRSVESALEMLVTG